ncbi:MAG: 50S ribosomal protein L11 methyltransferase [Pseudanabaenaceae cyanobacterium bins.68]|nr:50S ribosomal protein L11 methyltransferase [Pseudanabaenaceae cyanobacterium bins.68]
MQERWWEISILADRSLEEYVIWRLQQFGCDGLASQVQGSSLKFTAYINYTPTNWLDLAAVNLRLKQDAVVLAKPLPVFSCQVIWGEDWSSSWKANWHPQSLGDRLIIYPAWIEVQPDPQRLPVRIDPGSAFGTGAHATTQMSLEALEFRMWGADKITNFSFADIGCGSGILAIAALFLGAKQVFAVDTDGLAIEAMHHNCELNQINPDRFWVEQGSIEHLLAHLPEPVDGFACNIQAHIIAPMIKLFVKVVKPQGWGILSGILVDQAPEIMHQLTEQGWTVATVWKREQWSCLTIRRE